MGANSITETVDPKIQQDHGREETNVERLKEYFQLQKSGYEVKVRQWTASPFRRFYFAKDNQNEYIFDVKRDVLQDLTSGEIIARLEAAEWEQLLKSHPQQVVRFTGNTFTFDDWPR